MCIKTIEAGKCFWKKYSIYCGVSSKILTLARSENRPQRNHFCYTVKYF